MSSAGDQKLFCGVCSAFNCSFDEFVGEKVVAPSYSSTMLAPPLHHSHIFKNFSQFIVIHTVKGFGIVNKAEEDIFLELSCFFDDATDVGSLITGSFLCLF